MDTIKTKPRAAFPGPWACDIIVTDPGSNAKINLSFRYKQSQHVSFRGCVWGVKVSNKTGTAIIIASAKLEHIPVEVRFNLPSAHRVVDLVVASANDKKVNLDSSEYVINPATAIAHDNTINPATAIAHDNTIDIARPTPRMMGETGIKVIISGRVVGMDGIDISRTQFRAHPQTLVLDYAKVMVLE